jgi:hypothetical protein
MVERRQGWREPWYGLGQAEQLVCQGLLRDNARDVMLNSTIACAAKLVSWSTC